ncbi:MAG: hypothetical protein MI924_32185 [Chloroflexales bacterium]|nr:hypothetical protein [Chloroflexales bacterium]
MRAIQGRYWRENPELFELCKRELMVEMLNGGNLWFIDPNTDLTLLLNQMTEGVSTAVVQQQIQPATEPQNTTPAP